jgi:hypothetical protein
MKRQLAKVKRGARALAAAVGDTGANSSLSAAVGWGARMP